MEDSLSDKIRQQIQTLGNAIPDTTPDTFLDIE